jgi:hypothetical protein
VLEKTGGKVDIQAMDDQIPLFILLLLGSNLSCPHLVWNLMYDSLNEDQRMESDGRLVTLLETACDYVTCTPFEQPAEEDPSKAARTSAGSELSVAEELPTAALSAENGEVHVDKKIERKNLLEANDDDDSGGSGV